MKLISSFFFICIFSVPFSSLSQNPFTELANDSDFFGEDISIEKFYEIAMDRKIKVKVPVVAKGKSKGVELGGMLQIIRRELDVFCLPHEIPKSIEIDIADLDVGKNIGARLQADQAEADLRVAQAKAETRRAMAVAEEQEMKARTQEMQATVVKAEAEVPKAMAQAFREGNLGVFDYYNLGNIKPQHVVCAGAKCISQLDFSFEVR